MMLYLQCDGDVLPTKLCRTDTEELLELSATLLSVDVNLCPACKFHVFCILITRNLLFFDNLVVISSLFKVAEEILEIFKQVHSSLQIYRNVSTIFKLLKKNTKKSR
jgi:hypothetical protein